MVTLICTSYLLHSLVQVMTSSAFSAAMRAYSESATLPVVNHSKSARKQNNNLNRSPSPRVSEASPSEHFSENHVRNCLVFCSVVSFYESTTWHPRNVARLSSHPVIVCWKRFESGFVFGHWPDFVFKMTRKRFKLIWSKISEKEKMTDVFRLFRTNDRNVSANKNQLREQHRLLDKHKPQRLPPTYCGLLTRQVQ